MEDVRVLEKPALRLASIRTLGEPSLARCMLGSECNGGRCNLDIGFGTGETAQPSQGSRAVARNTAFARTQRFLRCGDLRHLGFSERLVNFPGFPKMME